MENQELMEILDYQVEQVNQENQEQKDQLVLMDYKDHQELERGEDMENEDLQVKIMINKLKQILFRIKIH